MSIRITRNSALTAQPVPAPDFRAAAAAARQGAEPAAQVAAKPTLDDPYGARALKHRFDNAYTSFQKAWQDSLVYAAAEFLYEQHRADEVLPQVHYNYYGNGQGQYIGSVADWYDVLTKYGTYPLDSQEIAFRKKATDRDASFSTVAELKASFTSKSPNAAAPYMAKAMAHFNTPKSSVRQALDYLISISADVGSVFVTPATAFTLLAKYKGVLSHWGFMLKCLEPGGGPLTDKFNKIKKKAKSFVQ